MPALDAYRAVIDYAGAGGPMARAASRINELETACDAARESLVMAMRADGWSWQEVGDAFGVTHQAARTRFRARGIK
jgi:hypothetical protein